MNPIKALGCRLVQAGFRLAMPVLPYRRPGQLDSVEKVPALLAERQVKNVLLVTDGGLRRCGVTKKLEEALKAAAIRCTVYDGTCANPTVEHVEDARILYRSQGCQAIIAFGGGSAMDGAKALGARIVRPEKKLGQLKGLLRVRKKLPPLIAIPTTAGTGSEVTPVAVITDRESFHKYTVLDFALIPSYAVLDPEVTVSLPPMVTATTGMDALTHAVEAYIGRSTTRRTRALALEATKLIFENLERVWANGEDREGRRYLLRAAYLAGEAFSKSYVGYIHAVAHSLGGQYDTPHGLANAVIMPYVLEDYGAAIHKKLHDLAVAAGIARAEEPHRAAAEKLIAAIRAMNRRMGIPETLPGIRREDIPAMARHAEQEANPLYPVPVLKTQRELERYYEQIADWREGYGQVQLRRAG